MAKKGQEASWEKRSKDDTGHKQDKKNKKK